MAFDWEREKGIGKSQSYHHVQRLLVYDIKHSLVVPPRVNGVLRNSPVEVHFNLKH